MEPAAGPAAGPAKRKGSQVVGYSPQGTHRRVARGDGAHASQVKGLTPHKQHEVWKSDGCNNEGCSAGELSGPLCRECTRRNSQAIKDARKKGKFENEGGSTCRLSVDARRRVLGLSSCPEEEEDPEQRRRSQKTRSEALRRMERASEDGEAVRERDRASRHQARQAEDESRRIREAASDMFETAERAVVHASFGPYDQSTTASWDEPACYETADLKRRQLAMNSVASSFLGRMQLARMWSLECLNLALLQRFYGTVVLRSRFFFWSCGIRSRTFLRASRDSICVLARAFELGGTSLGVTQDLTEAALWYRKLAEDFGDCGAAYWLACYSIEQADGLAVAQPPVHPSPAPSPSAPDWHLRACCFHRKCGRIITSEKAFSCTACCNLGFLCYQCSARKKGELGIGFYEIGPCGVVCEDCAMALSSEPPTASSWRGKPGPHLLREVALESTMVTQIAAIIPKSAVEAVKQRAEEVYTTPWKTHLVVDGPS